MSPDPAPAPAFAELVAATNYSFLRGASHPAEMVARALELGLAGIGIADRTISEIMIERQGRRRNQ